jgi:hypothetical protein
MQIDRDAWVAELQGIGAFFESLGPTFPPALEQHRRQVLDRLMRGGS